MRLTCIRASALAASAVLAATGGAGCTAGDGANRVEIRSDALWTATGSLGDARDSHAAVLLGNGDVLVLGGIGAGTWPNNLLKTAYRYNPANAAWTATGSLAAARSHAPAVRLASGRVLVAGGCGVYANQTNWLPTAEVYDPASGTWSATASMSVARLCHTLTRLLDGQVLAVGGAFDDGTNFGVTATAERYNATTGTWSPTGSLATPREEHAATLLPSGKVLVSGGKNGNTAFDSAEIYDPATGSWSATGKLPQADWVDCSANQEGVVLADGTVLHGGWWRYDPAVATWSAVPPPSTPASAGYRRTQTLLGDRRVLYAGGTGPNVVAGTDIFEPSTGGWSVGPTMNVARYGHTATLLADGRVLVAGGKNAVYLSSAELWDPTSLTLTPAAPTVAPRGTVTFSATGGKSPYVFSLAINNSGASLSGSTYTAGATGNVKDTVRVTDSAASTADAIVSVTGGIVVAPATATAAPGDSISFTATGGGGSYAWSLPTNGSGASIQALTGVYTAGSTGGVTDVVKAADSVGNGGTATVTVAAVPDGGMADGGAGPGGGPTVDAGPPPAACDRQMTYGKLQIVAANALGADGGCLLSDVIVNEIGHAPGAVDIDSRTGIASGTVLESTLSVLGRPLGINDGAFTVVASTGRLRFADATQGSLVLAGLRARPPAGTFGLGRLDLDAGTIVLPAALSGTEFPFPPLTLSKANGIQLHLFGTTVGGAKVELARKWSFGKGPGAGSLAFDFKFDLLRDALSLDAALECPVVIFEAGATFLAGKVDRIKLVVGGAGVPIGTTGFFLYKAGGQLEGLAAPPLKVTLIAGIGGPGPRWAFLKGSPFLAELNDAKATLDFGGAFSLGGELRLLGLQIAKADATLDWAKAAFRANGRLKLTFGELIDVLGYIGEDPTKPMRVVKESEFLGASLSLGIGLGNDPSNWSVLIAGKVGVYIPEDFPLLGKYLGGIKLSEVGLSGEKKLSELILGASFEGATIVGWALDIKYNVGKRLQLTPGVKLVFTWIRKTFTIGDGFAGTPGLGRLRQSLEVAAFELPSGLRRAAFDVQWEGGPLDVALVDPKGRRFSLFDRGPGAVVQPAADAQGLLVMVDNPEPGPWRLAAPDSAAGRSVNIAGYELDVPPTIRVLEPARDVASPGIVDLRWVAQDDKTGATVSLYYQGQGVAGGLIAQSLDGATGRYAWNTANVPGGVWRVVALVDDGVHSARRAVSPGRVTVTDPLAPATPTGVVASPGDGGAAVRWTTSTATDLFGYRVYFTDRVDADDYDRSMAVEQASADVTGLTNGRPHRMVVTAYDLDGHESLPSGPIVVTPRSAGNNPPHIPCVPVLESRAGLEFLHTVKAQDIDGDAVTFRGISGPPGLTVGASGEIAWRTRPEDAGRHEVAVAADDGRGGTDTWAFDLVLTSPVLDNRPPKLDGVPPRLEGRVGQELRYRITATDPDGDALTFVIYGAPEGLAMDQGTGELVWTPVAGQGGEHAVIARVWDGGGDADQKPLILAVAPARGCGCGTSAGEAGMPVLLIVLILAASARRRGARGGPSIP